MLIKETELRSIIRRLILEGEESKEALGKLEDALEDLPEFPMGMLSKIDKTVDQDLEEMEKGHVGDEGLSLIAGALLSAPMILKCIKWLAKAIGVVLSAGGILFDYEDNAIMYALEKLEHMTHDLYAMVFESIGGAIVKLVTGREPTSSEKKRAGKILNFTVLICVGVWGFKGLMHALHNHDLWLECGETLVGCIGYAEGSMLLIAICDFAQAKQIAAEDAEDQRKELGLPEIPFNKVNFA